MALISSFGPPDIFKVERSSIDRKFVHLYFTSSEKIQIKAKQLYIGKRYIFDRLLVGRFKDFWKKNENISIRGNFNNVPPPNKFEIEPLTENEIVSFWKEYVRPDKSELSPSDLLPQMFS